MNLKKTCIIIVIGISVVVLYFGYKQREPSIDRKDLLQNPFFAYPIAQAGLTELHLAVIQGDVNAVHKLVEKGVDINCKCSDGTTPLHLAAVFGQKISSEILISNGADINAVEKNGDTPLALAALGAKPEVVKLLLSHGAKVDTKNRDGKTPLSAVLVFKNNISQNVPFRNRLVSEYVKNLDKCAQLLKEHGAN